MTAQILENSEVKTDHVSDNNMTEKIIEKIKNLPPEKLEKILDYVEFIEYK